MAEKRKTEILGIGKAMRICGQNGKWRGKKKETEINYQDVGGEHGEPTVAPAAHEIRSDLCFDDEVYEKSPRLLEKVAG